MTSVLMVDDDHRLVELLRDYLAPFGFSLLEAPDGPTGLDVLGTASPEAVILDVMLPGWDGFEVCRRIRMTSDVPLIMLSARSETVDRIVGLELGADDYLPKPFEPRELVTRLQTILRRGRMNRLSGNRKFPGLSLSPSSREAFDDNGQPLRLTSMEFDLLWFLSGSPGQKFSRDQILGALQGGSAEVYSRSVDILVSRLRAKLGDNSKNPRYIKSSRGWGYVFLDADASE